MSLAKEILIPFFIGGVVISSVKFISTHLDNPALAAIIGGIPTGLISIYFLSSQKSLKYSQNYFFVTLSLLTAILSFYLMILYTDIEKNKILIISIVLWMLLVLIRYYIARYT